MICNFPESRQYITNRSTYIRCCSEEPHALLVGRIQLVDHLSGHIRGEPVVLYQYLNGYTQLPGTVATEILMQLVKVDFQGDFPLWGNILLILACIAFIFGSFRGK